MEKVKKISKYVVNGLNMINVLLVGLGKIFEWNISTANEVIILVTGVISAYLVRGKLFETKEESDEYDIEKGED